MTLKKWALKVSELKELSRAGRLLLAGRCALRVSPWSPSQDDAPRSRGLQHETLWQEGLQHVARFAFGEPEVSGRSETLALALRNQGAAASNALEATDEPLGRCINYAACTLAGAVEATSLEDGPGLKKEIVEIAKQSASIPAVLAHAGRTSAPSGEDPVEAACLAAWNAIRGDVSIIALNLTALESAEERLELLRDCAPLWIGSTPEWVKR